jgi:hypothetical protein
VNVGAGAEGEPGEEVVNELGLQIADACHPGPQIDDGVRASAEVDGRDRERFIHRHDEIAGAIDAAPVAERLRDGLAERDPEILHGVMLVDVEVALGIDAEVEHAVARHQFQHVIEKPDAGAHLVGAFAIERDRQRNPGLGGPPIDHRPAHSTSSITAMQRRVCSTTPVPMRTQPAQPGSVERSRR